MRILKSLLLTLPMAAMITLMAQAAPPEVGTAAPDYKLVDADGKTYTLAEERGKRGVVIAWFPKPFTPG